MDKKEYEAALEEREHIMAEEKNQSFSIDRKGNRGIEKTRTYLKLPVERLVVFLYPSCTGATERSTYGSRRISRFCKNNRLWCRPTGIVRY